MPRLQFLCSCLTACQKNISYLNEYALFVVLVVMLERDSASGTQYEKGNHPVDESSTAAWEWVFTKNGKSSYNWISSSRSSDVNWK